MPYTVRPDTIVGYTYDADVHCTRCASQAFGQVALQARLEGTPGFDQADGYDTFGIRIDAEDFEGNRVHPIFASDERPEFGEDCGDCGRLVRDGVRSRCACGDGCDAGDCPSCDDPEDSCGYCGEVGHDVDDCPVAEDEREDEPEYDQADWCDCANCIAASEYTGEVE